MKEDRELNQIKENNRIKINLALLGICFTLFTFLIAFNPELLKNNLFLTLQLVCSIPLFMTSILARTKSSYTQERKRWKSLGFITYLLGYAFLINVIGIFLIDFVTFSSGLIFFSVNIFLALTYSILEISYDSARLKERFFKDLAFILILVLLGILPAIGVY